MIYSKFADDVKRHQVQKGNDGGRCGMAAVRGCRETKTKTGSSFAVNMGTIQQDVNDDDSNIELSMMSMNGEVLEREAKRHRISYRGSRQLATRIQTSRAPVTIHPDTAAKTRSQDGNNGPRRWSRACQINDRPLCPATSKKTGTCGKVFGRLEHQTPSCVLLV
jgi:hypothetical protein